jgi:hypothetical protein
VVSKQKKLDEILRRLDDIERALRGLSAAQVLVPTPYPVVQPEPQPVYPGYPPQFPYPAETIC